MEAPLTTIDQAVAELKLDRVDYIKMDIEGAETRALAGGQKRWRNSTPACRLPPNTYRGCAAFRRWWGRLAGYRITGGPCLETNDGHVRPDVLYFR